MSMWDESGNSESIQKRPAKSPMGFVELGCFEVVLPMFTEYMKVKISRN